MAIILHNFSVIIFGLVVGNRFNAILKPDNICHRASSEKVGWFLVQTGQWAR